MARTCGWSHTYSRMSPSWLAASPTTLATSSAAPPPKPITLSALGCREASGPGTTLGHTQRRAAAKADHAVRLVLPVGQRPGHDLGAGRVAKHAAKQRHLQP